MEYFGLKLGQDLGNRAAHPYQKFRELPPPPPPPGCDRLVASLIVFQKVETTAIMLKSLKTIRLFFQTCFDGTSVIVSVTLR